MTNLDKIKAEAVERFAKVRTDAIGEMFDNVDKDGIYPTTKFFGKIDAALLSEIDRAVEATVGEMRNEIQKRYSKEKKDGMPSFIPKASPSRSHYYERRQGFMSGLLVADDLLQKLSSLNEK